MCKTRRYVVLFAQINVNDESILDLREASGRDTFDKHRSFIISKMAKNRTYFNEDYRKVDGKVIEHLKRISGYEVVINDFFVQFGLSRKYQIVSRVPNCTFLCVSNPTENISKDSIKIVEMGNI